MTISIQRVTCNVTLRAPSPVAEAVPGDHQEPPRTATGARSVAVQRTLEAEESGPVDGTPSVSADGQQAAAPIDPKKLADEVYRLMRDDLRIARERE